MTHKRIDYRHKRNKPFPLILKLPTLSAQEAVDMRDKLRQIMECNYNSRLMLIPSTVEPTYEIMYSPKSQKRLNLKHK